MKFLWIVLVTFPCLSLAHPVSFRDSTGIMGFHSPNQTHNQINYSLRHWVAVGVHRFSTPNAPVGSATLASTNFLLQRWNGRALQANIYALIGAGHSTLTGKDRSVGFTGLQFDIEDRDYYFLAKQQYFGDFSRRDFGQTFVRAVLSPYVEKYDGIHSWIILEWQAQRRAQLENFEDLTPFLRLFYKNLLFEIGQSFKGFTRFNYIAHF